MSYADRRRPFRLSGELRQPAAEGIGKCLAWTGFHCIPAMQVVDLASGLVVWRGLLEPFHYEGRWHFTDAEAGPPIGCADEPISTVRLVER